MTARAQVRGKWNMLIAASAGRVAGYPAGGTVSIHLEASGCRLACGQQQTFTDRVAMRPTLRWMQLGGTARRLPVDDEWSGLRIDRVWTAVSPPVGSCSEPGRGEVGTGTADLPGTVAMARALHLHLVDVAASPFLAGASTGVTLNVRRSLTSGRTTRTLIGSWRVAFTPKG